MYVSNAAARGMLGDTTAPGAGLAAHVDQGTAAVLNIYSGTPPADADAALSGNTLLAQMVCAATAFSGYSDANPGGRATFAAISPDASADATGTAAFGRLLSQNAGVVVGQYTVGTSGSELNLNTVAISAGSTVSVTSATITQPEGP